MDVGAEARLLHLGAKPKYVLHCRGCTLIEPNTIDLPGSEKPFRPTCPVRADVAAAQMPAIDAARGLQTVRHGDGERGSCVARARRVSSATMTKTGRPGDVEREQHIFRPRARARGEGRWAEGEPAISRPPTLLARKAHPVSPPRARRGRHPRGFVYLRLRGSRREIWAGRRIHSCTSVRFRGGLELPLSLYLPFIARARCGRGSHCCRSLPAQWAQVARMDECRACICRAEPGLALPSLWGPPSHARLF